MVETLQDDYQLGSSPYLVHKQSQQVCSLRKLTARSPTDSLAMGQAVEEYRRTRCESISKLQGHYTREKKGYCSEESQFYLIFQGENSYSLREEFAKRRMYQQRPFSEQEIQQIAETYLCGLREYSHRFQKEFDQMSLESLNIDPRSGRMNLKDPWLSEHHHSDEHSHLMLGYPSPEKLRTAYSAKTEEVNMFMSNLFSVGVICLELKRLEFADGVYSKKKEVSYEEVARRVEEIRDLRLRQGVAMLLDGNPLERKKVYQVWGVENREEHYIQPTQNPVEQHDKQVFAGSGSTVPPPAQHPPPQ